MKGPSLLAHFELDVAAEIERLAKVIRDQVRSN